LDCVARWLNTCGIECRASQTLVGTLLDDHAELESPWNTLAKLGTLSPLLANGIVRQLVGGLGPASTATGLANHIALLTSWIRSDASILQLVELVPATREQLPFKSLKQMTSSGTGNHLAYTLLEFCVLQDVPGVVELHGTLLQAISCSRQASTSSVSLPSWPTESCKKLVQQVAISAVRFTVCVTFWGVSALPWILALTCHCP
jgi:hypothetical protein